MVRRNYNAAATRRLLIDSTFDCLVELGYHRTSTAQVCRLAGVARGTMLHHYPTKQALVLAAIEDILLRRAEEFQQQIVLNVDGDDIKVFVHRLWSAIRGPTFTVWLELAVAARTDPTLDAEFRSVMSKFDTLVIAIARTLPFSEPFNDTELRSMVSLIFGALNGFALDLLQKSPDEVEVTVGLLATWVEAQFNAGGDATSNLLTETE